MEKQEAQHRAIKLSMGDEHAEAHEHMDKEGRVHKCPACGHEMPMDEVLGHRGGIKLTHDEEGAEEKAHMDHEGRVK